ncbi:unnamed protein product [Camellia sinensis]
MGNAPGKKVEMAPKKRRSDEGEEEEKKPVIVRRELMVTRSSTRRLNSNSATDSLSSPKPKSKPRTKKAKTSAKEDVKEQKVQVQTAEVKAVADDSSKTIIIKHWVMCKQCNSFKTQAIQVKNGLESGLSGVNVLVNPEKVDKNAIKFKTKPLEHMDLMRRVYEGAMATGKYAWTPGAAFEPVATNDASLMDEEDCEDSSGLPPFQPAAQREHTVHHTSVPENDTPASVHAASSAINADDTPTSGRSKRKFSCTTHPHWKKG